MIRKGAVRLERDGQTLQVLEEGEIFGFTSLISGGATLDVIVEEDLLAYRLPRAQFQALLGRAFAGHFAAGTRSGSGQPRRTQVTTFPPDLAVPVGGLLRGSAVRIPPAATLLEAAGSPERADRVGARRTEPPGIVTDRDFRTRVLADGRSPETPLAEVLSAPLRTVPAETPVFEAWRILLDSGVHHLPVVRAGEIVGVLTVTDLLKCTASGPVAVMRGSSGCRARRAARLRAEGRRDGHHALRRRPRAAGDRRLRGPAQRDPARADPALGRGRPGPPPTPYAWMVFGSEGRREQMLLTDQDNALVWGDDTPEARRYFASFTERVNADLVAAGFPRCPGGYMATRWNGPLAEWEERFATWLDRPTPQALLEASIFFDFRAAHGGLSLASLEATVRRARGARVFLAAMAKSALTFHPPGGLMLRLRSDSSKLDLKLKGVSPIVFLARVYGLEVGLRDVEHAGAPDAPRCTPG